MVSKRYDVILQYIIDDLPTAYVRGLFFDEGNPIKLNVSLDNNGYELTFIDISNLRVE